MATTWQGRRSSHEPDLSARCSAARSSSVYVGSTVWNSAAEIFDDFAGA